MIVLFYVHIWLADSQLNEMCRIIPGVILENL